MTIPDKARTILQNGRPVAAELTASRPEHRSFLMVIPQVPDPRENPDAWIHGERWLPPHDRIPVRLKEPSFIRGYEIRFLEHHSKYTEEEWGYDYDLVLGDETTRVRRVFVSSESEIEAGVVEWVDLSQLQEAGEIDSALVNSPIEVYLNRPDERPHLWR